MRRFWLDGQSWLNHSLDLTVESAWWVWHQNWELFLFFQSAGRLGGVFYLPLDMVSGQRITRHKTKNIWRSPPLKTLPPKVKILSQKLVEPVALRAT